MKVVLAGLRFRRGVNAACLLLAIVAVAAAILGPAYSRASAEHLLDSRIEQRETFTTGLTYTLPAMDPGSPPVGDADKYRPPAPMTLAQQAATPLREGQIDRYWRPVRSWLLDRGGTLAANGTDFVAPLYWRDGMCRMVKIEGRCPESAGEALINPVTAKALEITTGDTVGLTFTEQWSAKGRPGELPETMERRVPREFEIVGTYQVTDPEAPGWFDPFRVSGDAQLTGSAGKLLGSGGEPLAPALLVDERSMTSQTFVAGADRPIDTSAVDLDTMSAARSIGNNYFNQLAESAPTPQTSVLELGSVVDQVRSERSVLDRVTLAAVAPLVVLGLLLLHALVSMGAQGRRPHVALAKLRGQSTRQVFRFAFAEPALLILVAWPVAAAVALGTARLVADVWLGQRVPVSLDTRSMLAGLAVTVAALVSASGAVASVIREPVTDGLASSVRAPISPRWILVVRSAVIALAVATVAQVHLSDSAASTGLLELVAPLFIALATAVVGVVVLPRLARGWVRRTGQRRGTVGYLASRRVARRPDLVTLTTPVLLAVSVTIFAASAWSVADDWRLSRAQAEVGAARTFQAEVSPTRLLRVTQELDPAGQYLAAAVTRTDSEGAGRLVMVDVSRLATVAAWNESWSQSPVTELQQRLTPRRARDPIAFTGSSLSIVLRDVEVTTSNGETPELHLRYLNDEGEQTDVRLGEARAGRLSAPIDECRRRCTVQQIYVSGSNTSVTDAQGSLTLADAHIDGKEVDWRLDDADAWIAARPFPVSPVDPPIQLRATAQGLGIQLYLGRLPPLPGRAPPTMISGIARISPADVPKVIPAAFTRTTPTDAMPAPQSLTGERYDAGVAAGRSVAGEQTPLQPVKHVAALPGVGDEGVLVDLAASLRQFGSDPDTVLNVQLWTAEDTPNSLIQKVRDAGVTLSAGRVLDNEVRTLRTDAFSLGWRIFLLAGALSLVLAVCGVFASAVAQGRWRESEMSSLRMVGLKPRQLLRAAVFEYAATLGFAVLAGTLSAHLALTTVLPAIDLGTVAEYDPPADYGIHWLILILTAAAIFLLSTTAAVWVTARTLRTSSLAALPWADQR